MAKNKRPQDRQEKQDEIVAAARELFLTQGYEATAMSRLAAAAGIAPNTIYWYFKDKDEVLAAVLSDFFNAQWQAYLQMELPQLIDKLLWLLARLQEASALISIVHTRMLASPAIQTWHDNFHRLLQALAHHELLTLGIAEADVEASATVLMFTVEGLLVHQYSTVASRQVCETFIRQLEAG